MRTDWIYISRPPRRSRYVGRRRNWRWSIESREHAVSLHMWISQWRIWRLALMKLIDLKGKGP